MTEYVDAALFVYTGESEHLCQQVEENAFQVAVTTVSLTDFSREPETFLAETDHVVFSGCLRDIKSFLLLAHQYGFSIGIIPLTDQKSFCSCYDLPLQLLSLPCRQTRF